MKISTKSVFTASFLSLALIAATSPSPVLANGPHHNPAITTNPYTVIKNAMMRSLGRNASLINIKVKDHQLTDQELIDFLNVGARNVFGADRPRTKKLPNGLWDTRWKAAGSVMKRRTFKVI